LRKLVQGLLKSVALVAIFVAAYAVGSGVRAIVENRHPRLIRLSQVTDPRGGSAAAGNAEASVDVSPIDTFRDVLEMVHTEYVEKVDDDTKLSAGAVRTMLYALDDPATRYWSPEQFAMLQQQLDGQYTGIGATLAVAKIKRNDIEQRRVTVVAPVPGGPAAKAGVRAGDFITEIDGHWVIAYDPRLDLNRLALRSMPDTEYRKIMKDATEKLTDGISWPRALETLLKPKEKELKLTLERPGATQPITVTVVPATVQSPVVEFRKVSGDIGYVRVTQFSPSAPAEIKKALADAGRIKGLILDLRDNPGGPDFEGARSVLASMAGSLGALGIRGEVGTIVKGTVRRPVTASSSAAKPTSVAVLVNKGTSNVAEVAAEACRKRAGAIVVGAATRGDWKYQKLVPLKVGAMTITAGKWLLAGGQPFPGQGITPDVMVKESGTGSADPVISRAVSLLGRKAGGA